jgi:predicted nucleic acid-binding protein
MLLCLDTNIYLKALAPDELDTRAVQLVLKGFSADTTLIAPAWMWAEFGSVLCKKFRTNVLTQDEAAKIWQSFGTLPIRYLNSQSLRDRAWSFAQRYRLPTLYDAVFLACAEVTLPSQTLREFWTADQVFLNSLGTAKPNYVKSLNEFTS